MVQVTERLSVGLKFKSWIVACWIGVIIMTLFNLQNFIDNPTAELLDICRKDE